MVDKTKEPPTRHQNSNLKRNDSLTKKEKDSVNARLKRRDEKEGSNKEDEESEKENSSQINNIKSTRGQRKVRRRHTVGGTKDFAEWEQILNNKNLMNQSNVWVELGLAVTRNLEAWLQSQEQQQQKIRASSPDLTSSNSVDLRRLSLPDSSFLADATPLTSCVPMPSLLESQV